MDWQHATLASLIAVLFSTQLLAAEPFALVPPDGQPGDLFGLSNCLEGNTAVIGAPADDGLIVDAGSCYIYERQPGRWDLGQHVWASQPRAGANFGRRLAIDGDYLAVSAVNDDEAGIGFGAVHMFRREAGQWVEQQKILPVGTGHQQFGWSVSISGDRMVVGSDKYDSTGGAFVYRNIGSSWQLETVLRGNDSQPGDAFGHWVSIDGDSLVAGACGDGVSGTASGSAYVFRWNGTTWAQQAKLVAPDGAPWDGFGACVSVREGLAAIAAHRDDDNGTDTGSAYLFSEVDGHWEFLQKLTANDGDYTYFGNVTQVADGYIAAWAYTLPMVEGNGACYIFREELGQWTQVAEISGAGEFTWTSEGLFGMPPQEFLFGAEHATPNGIDSGSAYVVVLPEPSALGVLAIGIATLLSSRRQDLGTQHGDGHQ